MDPMSKLTYVTPEEMRRIDAFAIEEIGIPGVVLMENAGHAVFEAAYKSLAGRGLTALVFCGRGNNGGDGFVVAHHLINNGIETHVFLVGAMSKISLINEAGCPVLAIDIPSGLDGVTGKPLGVAVVANMTITFQLPKKGFENPLARRYTGELKVVDIGIPLHLYRSRASQGPNSTE
jgi:NAD(P)H-hydrate repair Nnr-like enzyme with NAD(P)H-hydrate epimerase domain